MVNLLSRYLIYLCIALSMWGCSSQSDPTDPWTEKEEPEVTLCLQVSVNDAVGTDYSSTREEEDKPIFEPPAWQFEKIHTLRVIIVRPDNTVEHNRFESLPPLQSVNKIGEWEFKVSTDQGIFSETNPTERTEKKRIFLIANEAAIQPEGILNTIKNLNVGDKIELSDDGAPSWIIENQWADYAVPMIDNDNKTDEEKMFVPMTEFYEVDVKVDLNQSPSKFYQHEKMFITRALIKFEFSVDTEGITNLLINSIRFGNLNQKEYLFPYHTKYDPGKYTHLNNMDEKRTIVEYEIPENNNSGSYIFSLENLQKKFGYPANSTEGIETTYTPQLYFCESQTYNGDEQHNQKYEVSISGRLTTDKGIEQDFKFTPQPLPNLTSLPRNTVVRIHFLLRTYEALCDVTVFPYTGVYLNPTFGFGNQESEGTLNSEGELIGTSIELTVNSEITLNAVFNLDDTTNKSLTWTTSDPSIIAIFPTSSSEMTLNGQSIELPANERVTLKALKTTMNEVTGKDEPVIINVYAQNGKTVTCKVSVLPN